MAFPQLCSACAEHTVRDEVRYLVPAETQTSLSFSPPKYFMGINSRAQVARQPLPPPPPGQTLLLHT